MNQITFGDVFCVLFPTSNPTCLAVGNMYLQLGWLQVYTTQICPESAKKKSNMFDLLDKSQEGPVLFTHLLT